MHQIKETPRRLHMHLYHLLRLEEEEQIARTPVYCRQHERIPVHTSRTTSALEIIARLRWHRAHRQRRQIADIDSQLQRRCAGQKIRVRRPRIPPGNPSPPPLASPGLAKLARKYVVGGQKTPPKGVEMG